MFILHYKLDDLCAFLFKNKLSRESGEWEVKELLIKGGN